MSTTILLGIGILVGMVLAFAGLIWKALGFVAEVFVFSLPDPVEDLQEDINELKEEEQDLRSELEKLAEETDDPKIRERIREALAS